ncbi:MAG: hypothetical protein ACLU9S_19605 [Oscillospiraceae bacterium]
MALARPSWPPPSIWTAWYPGRGCERRWVIFAMKAGDWSRTELGTLALDGTAYLGAGWWPR